MVCNERDVRTGGAFSLLNWWGFAASGTVWDSVRPQKRQEIYHTSVALELTKVSTANWHECVCSHASSVNMDVIGQSQTYISRDVLLADANSGSWSSGWFPVPPDPGKEEQAVHIWREISQTHQRVRLHFSRGILVCLLGCLEPLGAPEHFKEGLDDSLSQFKVPDDVFCGGRDRLDSLTVLIHLHRYSLQDYRCGCLQSKWQGPLSEGHIKTFHTGLSANLPS